MHLRKDAGSALITCCHDLMQRFERVRSPDSVWNFGVVSFEPGAGNVVPIGVIAFSKTVEAAANSSSAGVSSPG